MATKVTFDPTNRLIIAKAGVVDLDAQVDLYSDAKEDWKSDPVLNRLRFPFRTIGGDDLGGGLTAGAYFFLANDLGWRLRPDEADHELTIDGNLYPEDTGQAIIVPTVGAYTVLVRLQTSSLTQATDAATLWTLALSGSYGSGSFAEAVQTILEHSTQLVAGGITKGEAFGAFPFTLVLTTDHLSPATGKSPTGQYMFDGMSAWAALSQPFVEFGFGVYAISGLTAAETAADAVAYRFTAADCDPVTFTVLPRGNP